jgi:hypothetical protein
MDTWVLIILLFTKNGSLDTPGSPLGVTSVPGYASQDDCNRAGSFLQDVRKAAYTVRFVCIFGPKDQRNAPRP